ncbi:DUF421 domain-containing protein [Virgibacillus alimentarius]|uniref:Uncharacterized membrane protein YcaP (DUF421 family) n=1 Tax=Virgibacillus alimentarius TaxID=698769 RepID=A0ABS4S632_9BACI|nr:MULTISPECIES: DUF421 domain-containing protein [Virgibacillus]MBP2256956.1 uncharacterized membrane protein YcaP (DUF421 family) [Virgibacillus alimentarius]HLR68054.1 DUF421 domain-containing protein [Virgibacillus sp.]
MPGWVEILIRTISLVVILFLMTKWLGKKQLAQLNIFEFISGIVLGGVVAIHTSNTDTRMIYGILAMAIWFAIPYAVNFISLKSKAFRNFTQGRSTVVIQDGKIMEDNLKKEGYTTDDLLENLRSKNMFKTADVEFAVLEPSGTLNVLPKTENKPLTPKDFGLKPSPKKEPQTVVMDGRMMLEPLANLNLNPNWLETELDKLNVSIENVFLAQADSDGQVTVDLYDDQIAVPDPTEKPLLLATIKKCQADLELFALETENKETEQMYQKNSQKAQQAIDLITPYLK